jgi:hypothetical protein
MRVQQQQQQKFFAHPLLGKRCCNPEEKGLVKNQEL